MSTVNKILVIEDEKPIGRALKLKLSASGFDVDLATDGKSGIDMLENNKYNFVLTDLIMPEVTGFEILEYINKEGIESHVIVLSNLGQRTDILKAKELGAKEFFIKSNTPLNSIIEYINSNK